MSDNNILFYELWTCWGGFRSDKERMNWKRNGDISYALFSLGEACQEYPTMDEGQNPSQRASEPIVAPPVPMPSTTL
jgi:hypothetical protein